jgi:hypothetical protein
VVRGHSRVTGCVRPDGRRHRLDEPEVQGEPGLEVEDPVRLTGKFALYEYHIGPTSGGDLFTGMQVADLRTGRKVATVDFDDVSAFPTTVYSRVLTRSGSFAWIQDRNERGSGGIPEDVRRTVQVCTVAACARGRYDPARPEAIADGFDIEARSLFRRKSRIFWVEAGERRSAPL